MIKVFLFIAFQHHIEVYSFASYLDIATFLQEIFLQHPPVRSPVLSSDLDIVLTFLQLEVSFRSSLFASVVPKTVYLFTRSSSCCCTELQALHIYPTLLLFKRKSVSIPTNLSFLPKVHHPDYIMWCAWRLLTWQCHFLVKNFAVIVSSSNILYLSGQVIISL